LLPNCTSASSFFRLAAGCNKLKRDGGISSYGVIADEVPETLSAGFRNEKHKAQWN
jgi:hypothetical protein